MKFQVLLVFLQHKKVAPLVGAWIEIFMTYEEFMKATVAPLVGAWIEIRTSDIMLRVYGRSSCRSVD